jgi:hypothetical protein
MVGTVREAVRFVASTNRSVVTTVRFIRSTNPIEFATVAFQFSVNSSLPHRRPRNRARDRLRVRGRCALRARIRACSRRAIARLHAFERASSALRAWSVRCDVSLRRRKRLGNEKARRRNFRTHKESVMKKIAHSEAHQPQPSTAFNATIEEVVALIEDATARLERVEVGPPIDKKRTLKPRVGWEPVVGRVCYLARNANLVPPGISLEEMSTRAAQASALQPLETALVKLTERVSSARFAAGSDAWTGALKLYALLQRCAVGDPDIATGLAPVTEYFAHRRRVRPAKVVTPAPSPVVASPPALTPAVAPKTNGAAANGAANGAATGSVTGSG